MFRYKAFISYAHADERWARWLHRSLESYRAPRGLNAARIRPIFRDREELVASNNLSDAIIEALASSEFLIVVCSPAGAASTWVNQEVETFMRLHGASRILCLFVAGEPNHPDRECLPAALRRDDGGEPLGADVRRAADGRTMARLKVAAALLGVPLAELSRRDQRRRNQRLAVTAAASVVGMAVTTVLAVTALNARDEAERQRSYALDEARRAEQVSTFLVDVFDLGDPDRRGDDVSVRDLLEERTRTLEVGFTDQPRTRASLMQTLAEVYQRLGLLDRAESLMRGAQALRLRHFGAEDEEYLIGQAALSGVIYDRGDFEASMRISEENLAAWRRRGGESRGLALSLHNLAWITYEANELDRSLALAEEALAVRQRLLGTENRETAESLNMLGAIYAYRDETERALEPFTRALEIRERLLGRQHRLVIHSRSNVAETLKVLGRLDEAERMFREGLATVQSVFEPNHPDVIDAYNYLGMLLLEKADFPAAAAALREAVVRNRARRGADNWHNAYYLRNYASALIRLGEIDAAERHLNEARETLEKIFEDTAYVDQAATGTLLGEVQLARARYDAARALLENAVDLYLMSVPPQDWRVARARSALGAALAGLGRAAEARALLAESLPVLRARFGTDGYLVQTAEQRLAEVAAAAPKPAR